MSVTLGLGLGLLPAVAKLEMTLTTTFVTVRAPGAVFWISKATALCRRGHWKTRQKTKVRRLISAAQLRRAC